MPADRTGPSSPGRGTALRPGAAARASRRPGPWGGRDACWPGSAASPSGVPPGRKRRIGPAANGAVRRMPCASSPSPPDSPAPRCSSSHRYSPLSTGTMTEDRAAPTRSGPRRAPPSGPRCARFGKRVPVSPVARLGAQAHRGGRRAGVSSLMTNPTACIVVIGNEILSGRTQDANVQFLATRLGALGHRAARGAGSFPTSARPSSTP